jgi:hypothetical protein
VHRDATSDAPAWLAEVTALAAHELGNSMTALTFAVDLLREREFGADEQRDVEEMRVVVGQASALVRLLARLASSPTAVARLDLAAVVREAAPLLERLMEPRLRCAIPDFTAPVTAARSGLERALVEMVRATRGRSDDAARLAIERDTAGYRVAVEGAAPASGAATALPELPLAHAFASAARGTLTARRLASGALRIDLALPAADGGQPSEPKRR